MAGRRSLPLRAALWCFIFVLLLAAGLALLRWQLDSEVAKDQKAELERIGAVRSAVITALGRLEQATGLPCSPLFIAQIREVAFLPDGLHEFLYAPDGKVHCSADGAKFDPPIELGSADIPSAAPHEPSWRLERDLAALRHPGAIGTIAQLGAFAVAIPPYRGIDNSASWHVKELVALGAEGRAWSIGGERGLHARIGGKGPQALYSGLMTAASTTCITDGVFCIASRADLVGWARDWRAMLALSVGAAALLAWILADAITSWIRRRWSFSERFRRGLSADTLVLNYQPIVEIATGEVVSVEVLARWRDIDGTIVSPARFIPLVAQLKRTRQFTQMVIDRAYAELSTLPDRGIPLRVNFNVFPCDFEGSLILGWLEKFRNDPRLPVTVELIEDEDIDVDKTRQCIEVIAAAGVPTFIDDFGIGYSSIERIARLPVQGVKLDRSFAMAPADSVLGQTLLPVIEMIRMAGRAVIVEGVETMPRLNQLRATGMVDCVQGFLISTPMTIGALTAFMARQRGEWESASVAA